MPRGPQDPGRNLYVGVARLDLHLPEARSLKEKRSQTRSLLERIRARHQVLVIEADHQDLHQRSTFAICALSTDPVDVEARLQRVQRTVDDSFGGFVLSWTVDVLQV
jgi:uncharacterized protein YlxP (DUF503 family)